MILLMLFVFLGCVTGLFEYQILLYSLSSLSVRILYISSNLSFCLPASKLVGRGPGGSWSRGPMVPEVVVLEFVVPELVGPGARGPGTRGPRRSAATGLRGNQSGAVATSFRRNQGGAVAPRFRGMQSGGVVTGRPRR